MSPSTPVVIPALIPMLTRTPTSKAAPQATRSERSAVGESACLRAAQPLSLEDLLAEVGPAELDSSLPPRGIARSELSSGYVVSTISAPDGCYETAVFSPGWPATGEAVALWESDTISAALERHVVALRCWSQPRPALGWQFPLSA